MNNLEKTQSPLRILKSIIDSEERRLFLSLLTDSEFVAKDLELSIVLWLDMQNDKEYTKLFYMTYNMIKQNMDSTYNTFHLKLPEFIQQDKITNYINFQGTLTLFMTPESKRIYIDSLLMNLCPAASEYILHMIFNEKGFIIEHEPNGRNECPDLKITWPDKTVSYIEVKSVLCSFFDDGSFRGKVNNAMKGVNLILKDMRLHEVKNNKCGTNLRNITTVFFFYFNNPDTEDAEYFKTFVVPAPLSIDCEFNKDGTFKELGQKSDTNLNTVLNLKIRSPFNKYNTLADRASLIATGKTISGKTSLISNTEGDYYKLKECFEFYKQELNQYITINGNIEEIKAYFNQLKNSKYNRNKFATTEDKLYIKETIKQIKTSINIQYGKGTVR